MALPASRLRWAAVAGEPVSAPSLSSITDILSVIGLLRDASNGPPRPQNRPAKSAHPARQSGAPAKSVRRVPWGPPYAHIELSQACTWICVRVCLEPPPVRVLRTVNAYLGPRSQSKPRRGMMAVRFSGFPAQIVRPARVQLRRRFRTGAGIVLRFIAWQMTASFYVVGWPECRSFPAARSSSVCGRC